MLLADMAETFDNLRKINMKLNLKKCSFGVEEGKFLGYMKGKQSFIQYASRTLNQVERNYAPMEKLALSLVHMMRRLRWYFEAHPVKVITDQPIKQILSKTEAFGKLEKYVVELGAYNITFEPKNVVKGQKSGRCYGASSSKGSGESLVLNGPSGVEHTYALRLTFDSTNNVAEYEALLAGLRIARRMNIQNLEAKVDSKLVASQINDNYIASYDKMMKYLAKEKEYIACFKSFSIKNIPRNQNQKSDVLNKLASVAFNHLTKEFLVEIQNERSTEAPGKVKYVIVAVDYFTKWIEAKPLARITNKREDRHGETPFSLSYGSEVVIPAEIGMPTYRTMMIREGLNKEEIRLNLDLLTERRELAAIQEAKYKKKLEQYYNKKVYLTSFKPTEFVFQKNKTSRVEYQGKLGPKWEGPYRVAKAYQNGSYKLQTMEDKEVPRTWHAINL
nr:reverse transcriptase domain-containing protein [Tanacetum cinerariifolium]